MARTPEAPFVDEAVLGGDAGEERWPILYTALVVVVSSATLWALIIGVIGWLLF